MSNSVYNPNNYYDPSSGLTQNAADQLYLSKSDIRLPQITSISAGAASASKALVLDASKNISGINSFSASSITPNITDSANGSISTPFAVTHTLSSGSPTNNGFGIAMTFNGPNQINNIISYGRIYSTCQLQTSGLHQGSLTLSSVFAGNFVDVMTISTLTSTNNNSVAIAGNNSILSVTNVSSTNLTGTLQTASQPNINSLGSSNLSIAGTTSFTNTSSSNISTSNSVQFAGGAYIGKNLLLNGWHSNNAQFTGSNHISSASGGVSLYDNPIYFRGQAGNDSNHGIMYSGNGNSSWNSNNGWGNSSTYSVDGPVLWGNQGVILGNLNSNGTETICATFSGTTTLLNGKLNVNTPTTTNSQVNIQSFGSALAFTYDANHYTNFNSQSDGTFSFTLNSLQSTPTYLQYYFGSPNYWTLPAFSLAGGSPRFRLDLGAGNGGGPSDIQICLYNPSNITPTSGWGFNNSALQHISSGSNGHRFYSSYSLSGTGAQTGLGTLIGQIDQFGNIKAQAGFRCVGSNPLGYSGGGAEIEYINSTAHFFGYNRTTLLQTAVQLGDGVYVTALGATGIGTQNTSQYLWK